MKIASEREVQREGNRLAVYFFFSPGRNDRRMVVLSTKLLPPVNRTIQFTEFDIADSLNKLFLLGNP